MEGLDLSDVDPMRHAETRRRVGLVVEYLNGSPTASRREAAASELGVTPGQFLRLVRAWRETGNAARLYGAGAAPGARRKARSDAPAAGGLIDAVIDELGADASFSDVRRETDRRSAAVGLPAPAASTVYARLNRRRGTTGLPPEASPSIAIVRCALRLPVTHAGTIARPVALLSVLVPEGLVAAAEIGLDGIREPDLGRLMRRLVRLVTPGAPERPVVATPALTGNADAVVVAGVPIARSGEATSIVSKVFGQRLGGIRITGFARSDRAFEDRAGRRLNSAPSLVEATGLLIRAIETHNATRAANCRPRYSLAEA